MLSAPIKDGKAVLEELTGQRKEEAEDDDLDWEEEVLGEMEGGEPNDRFANYWNDDTGMTYPLILAKIPVKNPWEIFAYLPLEIGMSARHAEPDGSGEILVRAAWCHPCRHEPR